MLNIKNPRAHELAVELAAATGESLTTAVIHSLEERLERVRPVKRELDIDKIESLLQRIREVAPPAFFEGDDPTAFLYDEETGLPEMIIDTSVLVAIIRSEPDRGDYLAVLTEAMQDGTTLRMSAANLFELFLVVDKDRDAALSEAADEVLKQLPLEIVAVTHDHAMLARTAHRLFGRGSGSKARLNFGDCFAYALARELGEPLLFKGDDFARTDIEPALKSAGRAPPAQSRSPPGDDP